MSERTWSPEMEAAFDRIVDSQRSDERTLSDALARAEEIRRGDTPTDDGWEGFDEDLVLLADEVLRLQKEKRN